MNGVKKKGFTLVELLVVVVVIVTLMSITFKLAGAGGDQTARSKTVNYMQRLENCLSGYYAAYGSYPPVALHGSRDYTYEVDSSTLLQAIKSDQHIDGFKVSSTTWKNIEAACRSQPVAFEFPCTEELRDFIDAMCQEEMRENSGTVKYDALVNPSRFSSDQKASVNWTDIQIYKYGVLSYLLPRYLIVMGGSTSSSDKNFTEVKFWNEMNELPCRFEDGAPYTSWSNVNRDMEEFPWKIAAMPSQAATARWLPNLSQICQTYIFKELYGVTIRDPDDITWLGSKYSAGGYGSTSQMYVLNYVKVRDGWGNEFYYYSPPPHQTYTLWSSGANGKTFPPWVTDEELKQLDQSEQQIVEDWLADDIVHMSN